VTQPESGNSVPGRREHLCLLVIVLAALALRVAGIGQHPLHPDEIHYAYDALAPHETASIAAIRDLDCSFLVERRTAHPMLDVLLTRWLWVAPMSLLIDWSPGWIRGFHAMLGALCACLAWGAARAAWTWRHGLAAAALVALAPLLVRVSRTMYLDTTVCAAVLGMLWAAAESARRPGWKLPALLGLAFGLVMGTKLSAPLLGPAFLLACGMAPPGTPGRMRAARAAAAIAAACLTALALADPAAFVDRVNHPSDPRYAYYEGEMLTTFMAYFNMMVPALALELPPTLALFAFLALMLLRDGRSLFDGVLWAALAGMLPLFLLHVPALSGTHGLAPWVAVLCVLCSRVVELPARAAYPLLALHAAASLGSVTHSMLPRDTEHPSLWFNLPLRDSFHDAAGGRLYGTPAASILVVADAEIEAEYLPNTLRNVQLLGGALIWDMPATDDIAAASLVADHIVFVSHHAPVDLPAGFEWSDDGEDLWRVASRTRGAAPRVFAWGDMDVLPDGSRAFPGQACLIAGRVEADGIMIPIGRAARPEVAVFQGRLNFGDWGSGTLLAPSQAAAPKTITIVPAPRDDVFWDY